MRCSKCSKTWKLSSADGPSSGAAPGHFFTMAMVTGAASIGAGFYVSTMAAVAMAVLTAFILAMALVGCGHKEPKGTYLGSKCPECGHENTIMPWNT